MSVEQGLVTLGIPQNCIARRSSAQERRCRFSIRPRPGDEIWRVDVDGCWLQGSSEKRVDYTFWGHSTSGRRLIVLVGLKGKDFGRALEQIESTLQLLCKQAGDNIIHAAVSPNKPRHDPPAIGGVRAFVILSKGSGVPQRIAKRRKLQQQYGIIVYHHEQRFEIDGLDALSGGEVQEAAG